ncbi:uncharacterized protein L203_106025 [Cryptococcus depauperatus CBS 7841]|uniref:Uncharacterized protein n=1 Tax=Cryptococcus depauperatus CBS 7841 TaxID=1295531 RepID=A0A1E3IVI2_9TREE|nr:hypothetical protein L203_00732 [Cryptococcus depauperatus CBS 7841]
MSLISVKTSTGLFIEDFSDGNVSSFATITTKVSRSKVGTVIQRQKEQTGVLSKCIEKEESDLTPKAECHSITWARNGQSIHGSETTSPSTSSLCLSPATTYDSDSSDNQYLVMEMTNNATGLNKVDSALEDFQTRGRISERRRSFTISLNKTGHINGESRSEGDRNRCDLEKASGPRVQEALCNETTQNGNQGFAQKLPRTLSGHALALCAPIEENYDDAEDEENDELDALSASDFFDDEEDEDATENEKAEEGKDVGESDDDICVDQEEERDYCIIGTTPHPTPTFVRQSLFVSQLSQSSDSESDSDEEDKTPKEDDALFLPKSPWLIQTTTSTKPSSSSTLSHCSGPSPFQPHTEGHLPLQQLHQRQPQHCPFSSAPSPQLPISTQIMAEAPALPVYEPHRPIPIRIPVFPVGRSCPNAHTYTSSTAGPLSKQHIANKKHILPEKEKLDEEWMKMEEEKLKQEEEDQQRVKRYAIEYNLTRWY